MRRKIALILALAMALSAPVTAMAQQYFNAATSTEFIDPTTFTKPYEVNQVVVDADETTGQPRLEARTKSIIEADGLKFKDLNGNGQLDVYEDWRQDVDARVDDLLSQMTIDEEIGLLWHASTGGTFTSMYPYTEDWLYSNEPTYTDQDGNCYVPMYHSIISDNVTTYLHNVNGTPDTLIYENNAFQEIAESARLGVPVVLSCDRSYNTWLAWSICPTMLSALLMTRSCCMTWSPSTPRKSAPLASMSPSIPMAWKSAPGTAMT